MVERPGNAPGTAILRGSPAPLCSSHRWKLVEQRGNAPRTAILQGSPAPLCLPHGARTWFRATLSCSSGRRFHQISFPSILVRMPVIETGPSEWRSETRPSSYIRVSGGKWRESNFLPQRDGVYSAATAPAVLSGTSRNLAVRPIRSKGARLKLSRVRRSTSVLAQKLAEG